MKVAAIALTVAAIAAPALAQDAASALSSLPTCAVSCALKGIGASGCSTTDISCICKSDAFLAQTESCVSTACAADDQATTLKVASALCKSAGVTLSVVAAGAAASTSASASMMSSSPSHSITSVPATVILGTAAATGTGGASATVQNGTASATVKPMSYTGGAGSLQVAQWVGVAALLGLVAL